MCKRTDRRIECPNCGYPSTEARYMLVPVHGYIAVEPFTKEILLDPGCDEQENTSSDIQR